MEGGSGGSDVKQVFLSHCVSSLGDAAESLSQYLQSANYSVFICSSMAAGQDFRKSITSNAANCKIMVVFLDENWANSGECISEFNCAYSVFNKKGSPQFIPIVIGGFDWIEPERYPVSHCITANFHCLVKQERQQWDGVFQSVVKKCDAIMSEVHGSEVGEALDPQRRMFQDFVTCEICQEMFYDPCLLPCSHTFCRDCLSEWQSKNNTDGTLPCPKCRIEFMGDVNNLPSDLRASQLVELLVNQDSISKLNCASLGSMPTSMSNLNCDPDLADWLAKNRIPRQVTEALFENGFEFLDVVLEMTVEDVKQLGLKLGHERKLLKCLNLGKSLKRRKKSSIATLSTAVTNTFKKSWSNLGEKLSKETKIDKVEWKLIQDLYDDRILSTGTNPADSVKFWASLSKFKFDKIIHTVRTQADAVLHDGEISDQDKATYLHQA